MKIRLTHRSHVKSSEGGPGDVVTVDGKLGRMWLERGGAVPYKEDGTEAATRSASENAATRTKAPAGR